MRRNADYLICHTAVIGLALLCWPVPAGANPVGGRVAQGTATITSQGSQLTINTSDRAAINWASFNIGLGETTSFVQPSSSSVVWNYINNPLPSQILGNLNANGYLILQSPAGFYVGGNAAISAHGLVMTTSPTPAPVLSTSSPWQFNAPPPTASIINYGQIRTDGVAGGSLFLIAANVINAVDTVHGYVGSISAPQGNIGLFAGQQVMISTRADGRGLNARVTLPQGTVDNEGNITADAGMIALRAQTVNQGGLVQANSARSVNGVIELVASDTLTLGAGSVISAQGNAPAGTASPGGSVVLSGRTFIDQPTSQINVAGQSGAPNGLVQIFGNGTTLNSIMSTIDGESAADFAAGNLLLLNTYNLTLSSGPTDTSSSNPTLSVDDLAAYSKLALFAKHDILLNTWWYLPDSPDPNSWLTLEAGRNIALSDGSAAQAGRNWHFNFTAGTGLAAGSTPTPRTYGIYLTGTSFIESQNGDIDLWAANDVSVATGFAASVANNGIRTLAGGNIDVTTIYGNVNTGGNPLGYQYQLAAPY